MISHRMNCHLIELWLEESRRKPMTPAQMVRFCGRSQARRPSRVDRFVAVLGGALVALGQRIYHG